jgi:hypothetical protein
MWWDWPGGPLLKWHSFLGLSHSTTVTMSIEFALYGVGWFLARCWILHQLFLPQMCSVHWGRWTMLPIRWGRQNCEILSMVFGIKFKLFTYHYHYVTCNISARWKFFYRSWFQHYTISVWDAGTCLYSVGVPAVKKSTFHFFRVHLSVYSHI